MIHRILSYALYKTSKGYNTSWFLSEMLTMKPSKEDLRLVMMKYSYSEWFFLQQLASNLDGELAVDLLHKLAHPEGDAKSEFTSSAESIKDGLKSLLVHES